MILTYYPDTDTLDVRFRAGKDSADGSREEALEAARQTVRDSPERYGNVETFEADPSGQTLAHYVEGRLEELTIDHATRRAPAAWDIASLRQEAAEVAAATGRIVESVTYNTVEERTSFETGKVGPHSPHTSDADVREFNEMIDDVEKTSTAA